MTLFLNKKQQEQDQQMMMFRQGDILITQVDGNSIDHGKYSIIPDSKTVALGEITGHHHTFSDNSQVLLFKDKKDGKSANNNNLDDPTLIQVQSEMAELEHQEHNTILLPEGTYKITREVEYNPFTLQLQRTAD